jgi:hypothetical protein
MVGRQGLSHKDCNFLGVILVDSILAQMPSAQKHLLMYIPTSLGRFSIHVITQFLIGAERGLMNNIQVKRGEACERGGGWEEQ